MSASETGERFPVDSVARRPGNVTRMLSWAGLGGLRLEAVRVVLGERSMRATGSMVAAALQDGAEPYSASYSLATDESGVVRRLTVRTIRAQGEQHVTLSRSEEGIWLVDGAPGAIRTDFDGAVDVDLALSPLFNALPVRRLDLHRTAAEHELPMVFVALPGLEVRQVGQTYRTVSLDDPAVVSFASGSFQADLTVDSDGLVLEYPGLAQRA
jgi:hypothetical protein